MDLEKLERFTVDLAKGAGRLLMRHRRGTAFISKEDGSVQTPADVAAERLIRRRVAAAFPEAAFLGEESYRPVPTDGMLWICDPLDGTTNYLRGLPVWGSCLAVFQNGQPLVGVVYMPLLRETFSAARGLGARKNGVPVRVSTSDGRQFADVYTLSARDWRRYAIEGMSSSLRCLGSCAYHMSQMASGGTVGLWEYTPKIWDIAAGVLLIREAGGIVENMDGGDPIERFLSEPDEPARILPVIGAANRAVLEGMRAASRTLEAIRRS